MKFDELKASIIKNARQLIDDWESDIDSGIEEGIYEEEDNEDNYKRIEQMRKELDDFEAMDPAIYTYVEGGNIQGHSVNCRMSINVFDEDHFRAGAEDIGTPEEWDAMIKKKTADGEIRPVL